jgi:phage baseplate assembly protein W
MAITISRVFKDISLSFTKNPITNDIVVLYNEDAIKKSVINLVRTQIGERFFNNLIGTSVQKSLFELNISEISVVIDEEITNLLNNFEPRVRVRNVSAEPEYDTNDLNVMIEYDIVGAPLPSQSIEFLLQPTRL